MERRLVVDFDIPGVPVQHYRAERCAAEAFAAEATRQGLARVTVDDLATDEMKQLPYQRLFMPSRRDDAYLWTPPEDQCGRSSGR